MERKPKQSLKSLLDRQTEKPILEALYIQHGVASDQLRRDPAALASITATFNRLTSRDLDQGTLLRYIFNRRKNDGGDWPNLGSRAKKFQPVGELLTPAQIEVLRQIYEKLDIPSDEFLFQPKLTNEIAQQFMAATGEAVSPSLLVALIVSKRKRGEWCRIREQVDAAFSDIDEVAKRFGTQG